MEYCGGPGLYGYVQLGNNLPSGTQGDNPPSSATGPDNTLDRPSLASPAETLTTSAAPVRTVVTQPSETGDAKGAGDSGRLGKSVDSFGVGPIVGIVGVVGAILLASGLLLFCCLKL